MFLMGGVPPLAHSTMAYKKQSYTNEIDKRPRMRPVTITWELLAGHRRRQKNAQQLFLIVTHKCHHCVPGVNVRVGQTGLEEA